MSTPESLANLDRRIASLERELEIAQKMRELVADDPDAAESLVRLFSAAAGQPFNGAAPAKKQKPGHGGPVAAANFKKIVAFLESADGRGKTVTEIMEGTRLTRSAVVQCLYKTHQGFFEKATSPDSNLVKVWKLKKGVSLESVTKEG